MGKPLFIKSIFMFISIWTVAIMLLWFRRSIEIFWKITATLILGFYFWFFFEEISTGYVSFKAASGWYNVTINFLTELIGIVFTDLFFLWPVALIVIFYKSDDVKASKLLKFMCILTLVLWITFIIYSYYDKGISEFIIKNIKQMLQKAK